MDFATLQQAVADRGLTYLQDAGTGLARLKRGVNSAYQELCSEELWDFLLTSGSTYTMPAGAAAFLGPTNLRQIETVTNTSTKAVLEYRTRQSLVEEYGDLTLSGSSLFYYFTAQDTITTYPVDSVGTPYTITYWKVPADLSGGTDTPVVPSQWHKLIEDLAVFYLAEDADTRALAQQNYAQGLDKMRETLMGHVPVTWIPPVGDDC